MMFSIWALLFFTAFGSASFIPSKREGVPPTCALKYPCPPPQWKPQWQLNLSTICQPGVPDYFLPPDNQQWGLVSLDWSNGINHWLKPNRNESTCEATSIYNAQLIKQKSPGTRVFVYHNLELALQWLETQRPYMYDPTKANYFLQYTDGKGNKNGTIFNEPRDEGDQYFWDFRVPEAGQAYIKGVLDLVQSPYVDGIFTDDVDGLPAEHPEAPKRIGLTEQEIQEVQFATQTVSQQIINAVIKLGKYNWQAFSYGGDVGPAPNKTTCVTFMREFCAPEYQYNPMTMQWSTTDKQQVLAAFLITRPPHGWLGFGWESDTKNWDPIFNTDVGTPQGLCEEGPTGVFSRKWTKGTVTLDCNTWQASGPFN